MASCSLPTKRTSRPPADSNSGVLPPDVLFHVLLLLPAKELCRLRVVCRSWRYLTSDPLFIKAHADRKPGSMLLASFRDDKTRIEITDLSGNVVKRIGNMGGQIVPCMHLELVCVATEKNYCHVINPATGAVYVLPESPAKEHVDREHLRKPYTSFAFGQVASTGEYKVLRMFNRLKFDDVDRHQLCEVFTVNGGAGHDRWRAKQSREILLDTNNSIAVDRLFYEVTCSVVVDGVVYFLMDDVYECLMLSSISVGFDPDCIASFDLKTEEWRKDIQGPISSRFDMDEELLEYISTFNHLTLGELKDHLVLVYHPPHSTIEMWFLTDFDKGLWEKEYSIQPQSAILDNERFVKPLLLLDDGRIVIHLVSAGLLLVYDPITNTFTALEMRNLAAVGVYTGSLLSLQNGDMV